MKQYFNFCCILVLLFACSQTDEILNVGDLPKKDKQQTSADAVREIPATTENSSSSNQAGSEVEEGIIDDIIEEAGKNPETEESEVSAEEMEEEVKPDPVLGEVEFVSPIEDFTSELATAEVSWMTVGSNLAKEEILYESKVCSEADCASNTCDTPFVSQDESRIIDLVELVPLYVCLRSMSNDMVLQSEWITSNAINFYAGNLDISLQNRVGTILVENADNLLLGNLMLTREIPNYSFEIVPDVNGDYEYFLLGGPNNSTVTFNSNKVVPAEVESITLTVKITGIEEIESRSFIFTVEHPFVDNNLVTNGYFDDGVNGWTLSKDNFYQVIDDNGDKYLEVTVTNPAERVHVTQIISLDANSSYTLSVKMSANYFGTPMDPIVVDTKDQFDPEAQFVIRRDSNWMEFSGTFTTGANPTQLELRLFQEDNFEGTARYDDVRLIKN